jgi:hypothetical protein
LPFFGGGESWFHKPIVLKAGVFEHHIENPTFEKSRAENKGLTNEAERSTNTSSGCRKKNIPQQKNSDMFLLFFGVIGESTNAVGQIFILTA